MVRWPSVRKGVSDGGEEDLPFNRKSSSNGGLLQKTTVKQQVGGGSVLTTSMTEMTILRILTLWHVTEPNVERNVQTNYLQASVQYIYVAENE